MRKRSLPLPSIKYGSGFCPGRKRTRSPGIRIIAISGGGGVQPVEYAPEAITTTAYLAAAKEAGADMVFTKPFERKSLIQAVTELLVNLH